MSRLLLLIFLFSSAVFADEVMICGNSIYRLDRNLLVADEIFERKDGDWKRWCRYGRVEIGHDGALCVTEAEHTAKYKSETRDFWTKQCEINGTEPCFYPILAEGTRIIDFYQKTLSVNGSISKCSTYKPR